jgi:hypothetical protein
MQSSRIIPLASAPAGCAVPYSTTRDHCGALTTFRETSQIGTKYRVALCWGCGIGSL